MTRAYADSMLKSEKKKNASVSTFRFDLKSLYPL